MYNTYNVVCLPHTSSSEQLLQPRLSQPWKSRFILAALNFFFITWTVHSKVYATACLWALTKKKNKIKIIPECEKFTKLPRARELEAAILEQCIDYSCCIDAQNAAAEAFECDCVKCNVTGQPGGFL